MAVDIVARGMAAKALKDYVPLTVYQELKGQVDALKQDMEDIKKVLETPGTTVFMAKNATEEV